MPSDTDEVIEMNEYHRTIVNFLRDYGATDVQIVGGGKHPHIDFLFKDKRFNLAVHQNGEAHTDAAIIKTKELRTLLGDPVEPTVTEPRLLEDMMPAAPNLPRFRGQIAMYRTSPTVAGLSLRIYPPQEIVDWIKNRPMGVERLANDTWLMKVNYADGRKPRPEGAKWLLTAGASMTKGYDTPFGVSPAEYMVVENTVRVRLFRDQVNPLSASYQERAKTRVVNALTAARTAPTPVAPAPMPVAPAPLPVAPATAAVSTTGSEPPSLLIDARRILSLITEFERATPYRLVRVKDTSTWAWQAPLIKLEEPSE